MCGRLRSAAITCGCRPCTVDNAGRGGGQDFTAADETEVDATSDVMVLVDYLPLDLAVLCIAAVVCGRLNSIVERQYTVGSRQAVQHCGRGRLAVQHYTAA